MRTTMATILVFLVCGALAAEHPQKQQRRPASATGRPTATMMDINRAAAWYEANGEQERVPLTGNAGLFYPIGTYANAVYCSGIIWSGRFNDGRTPMLRTNGQIYYNGTKPGAILGLRTGIAEDTSSADVRIWRIRRDYRIADLKQDAAYLNGISDSIVTGAMIDSVRAQYARDWIEWPAAKGAPFYDHDADGIYTPQFDTAGNPILYPDADEPGLAGADQVIWYVCNDIGVTEPWSCPETGMEEQTTIWAYGGTDPIANVIFKRFRLIYKGVAATPPDASISEMYFGHFTDIDIGDAVNDFSGCDTALSLGYTYNGEPVDAVYAAIGLAPACSGYMILQGPLARGVAGQDLNRNGIDDALDYGYYDFLRVGPGFLNLPMTAFTFLEGQQSYLLPPFNFQGSILWNQMLHGLPPQSWGPGPVPRVDPTTGKPTLFWMNGNPISRTGWLDGMIDAPGERQNLISSGPFSMTVGDTQEIVVCWAGGLGINYISSVAAMKWNAMNALQFYSFLLPPTSVNERSSSGVPATFALDQNYPNPFNPGTTIRYEIRDVGYVTLRVYDVLGREVAVLVNGVEGPGRRTARFDGTDLASGVYFYRLTAGGMSQTRKMLLLR